MATYASLVVATMAKRHAVSALWRAVRTAAAVRQQAGVDHCRAVQGARFRADTRPPYTAGRVGVMTWAHSLDTLDAADRDILRRFDGAAREAWRIVLEPVSVQGDWFGFVPDTPRARRL